MSEENCEKSKEDEIELRCICGEHTITKEELEEYAEKFEDGDRYE